MRARCSHRSAPRMSTLLRLGNRFVRSWRTILGAAAIAPLAVGQAGDYSDSSSTRFTFGAGAGTYAVVSRGCQGEILSVYKRDFRDAALGVEHEFRGPVSVGVRTQTI